uniref:Uncharacterized protein n=1 Tax=Pseudomonas aeruginosa TaxID=287 RepID=A0A3G1DGD4_PSEAI|nr:Hypothetical protein [Pseudomonas aeruginosa]QCO95660.1 gcu161 [Pseudomonas aeruginosa]
MPLRGTAYFRRWTTSALVLLPGKSARCRAPLWTRPRTLPA